ncbi:Vacuolar ATP synthase subunit S1 [Aphelenchoides bicaudatus]|nr:Vacuolar ATP synthase subunit S1 [Aphelenchoides bicaudatus]
MSRQFILTSFVLFSIHFVTAYDFLAWTSSDKTADFEANSWDFVKNAIKSATSENPIYLFAIQNTTVEDAAKKLNESSNRPAFRQIQNEEKLKIPAEANEAQYFLFNNFDDYVARAPTVADKFVVVLSDPSAFDLELQRRKRVSLNEDEGGRRGNERQASKARVKPSGGRQSSPSRTSFRRPSGRGKSYATPVVLPPYNRDSLTPKNAEEEYGTCLFYLETLVVYVFNKKSQEPMGCGAKIGSRKNKFVFSRDYVNCIQSVKAGTKQEFSFNIEVDTDKAEAICREKTLFTVEGSISVKLTFETGPGFEWNLVGVETDGISVSGTSRNWLDGDLSVAAGSQASESSVSYMDIGAPLNFNYACSKTKTAVFKTNSKNYDIGIGFENIQIQPIGYSTDEEKENVRFSRNTHDCVGTFSPGSLTGIIVTLVLASVFIFGFLMLTSVQTMDRFDDPKTKQLVINAKE